MSELPEGDDTSAKSVVGACLILAQGHLYSNESARRDKSYNAQVTEFVRRGHVSLVLSPAGYRFVPSAARGRNCKCLAKVYF